MSNNIIWPSKPTCHVISPVFKFNETVWRPPQPEGHPDSDQNPYGYPFRTCSYCGSIHPEDLIYWLDNGAKLGGSDWKYSWPHKLYVEGVVNPLAGNECTVYTYCGKPNEQELADGIWEKREGDKGYRKLHSTYKASTYTHAKWYNEHLLDEMSDEAFQLITSYIEKFADLRFRKAPSGKLQYAAPYHGYQR